MRLVPKDHRNRRIQLHAAHLNWYNFITSMYKIGRRKIGIISPWGIGKTTSLILGFPLYIIPKNLNTRIKIICNSDDNATDRVVAIQRYIEDDEDYKAVHGDSVIPSYRDAWSMHKFFVKRKAIMVDGTVEAAGISNTAIGKRADWLFFDDPVDYQNSVASKAEREKIKDLFYNVWLSRLSPRGCIILIGTPWHKEDLIHDLLDKKGWCFLIQRVREDRNKLEQTIQIN